MEKSSSSRVVSPLSAGCAELEPVYELGVKSIADEPAPILRAV